METMRKVYMLLISLFVMGFAVADISAFDLKDKFSGTWEVTVSDDGGEYLKFTMEIQEKENFLVYDI